MAATLAAALMLTGEAVQGQSDTPAKPSEAAGAPTQDPLQEARSLAAAGDTQAAVAELDELAAGDADESVKVQARYLKGMVLLGAGDQDAAAETFQDLIMDYPALPEPYNNLAAIRAAQGELDLARELLETLVARQPDYAIGYENLGDVYAKLAADAYGRATDLAEDPGQLPQKLELLNQMFGPSN